MIPRTLCLLAMLMPLSVTAGEEGEFTPPVLVDVAGNEIDLAQPNLTIVLEWVNFGCPCVRDHYRTGTLPGLQRQAKARGVLWIAIASTGEGLPGHMGAEELEAAAEEAGACPDHLVLDASGEIARAFGAITSPHIVLLKGSTPFYSGPPAEDCGRDGDGLPIEGGRVYLSEALGAALSGGIAPKPEKATKGCVLRLAREAD